MVSDLVTQKKLESPKVPLFAHRTLVISSSQDRSLHFTTHVDALDTIGSALDSVTSVGKNC